MRTIGNIIWVVFCGIWSAIGWLISGLILACTVVGIPFARQCLKMANFTLWPFGRTAIDDPSVTRGPAIIGNVIWFLFGIFLALGYAIAGVLMACTIIGIPFALQAWKFIPIALMPFGKRIVPISEVKAAHAAAFTRPVPAPASGPLPPPA